MKVLGDDIPTLKLIDCAVRLFVIPLSVASIWLTVTNQQDNSIYGKLEFSNLIGLEYMVCISAISAGYALAAAVSSWVKYLATKTWVFFVSDQWGIIRNLFPSNLTWLQQSIEVMAYLMLTSGAAVTEILYLAYNGDITVTWSEACSSYGRFCSRLKLILAFHAIAICCFFLLAVVSAYRVFSRFEPPLLPSKEAEEERT